MLAYLKIFLSSLYSKIYLFTYIFAIFVVINIFIMKSLDLTKSVKLRNPQSGEENLIFRVTNYNEVTNRCYIEPVSSLPGLNMTLPTQELVSINEIENAE